MENRPMPPALGHLCAVAFFATSPFQLWAFFVVRARKCGNSCDAAAGVCWATTDEHGWAQMRGALLGDAGSVWIGVDLR